MSEIILSNETPEGLFRENRDAMAAFLISPLDIVEGLDGVSNPEPNTKKPMIQGFFPNSDRTHLYHITYTIGLPESLANNAVEGIRQFINRTLFGENESNYVNFNESPKICVEKYLNGILNYRNWDVNKFKEVKLSQITNRLNSCSQLLKEHGNRSGANIIESDLIPLVEKTIKELGKENKSEKPEESELKAEEKQVEAVAEQPEAPVNVPEQTAPASANSTVS